MAGERCPEFESFRKGYFYQDTEDDHNANQWPRNTSMIGEASYMEVCLVGWLVALFSS